MVEVFKTNVSERGEADRIILAIGLQFPGHEAYFDLEDCDRVLRIACASGLADCGELISFLWSQGAVAEVLPG